MKKYLELNLMLKIQAILRKNSSDADNFEIFMTRQKKKINRF